MQMVTAAMKLKDSYSLGRKVISNLDSILRSRDITLPAKVPLVKAMVFMSLKSGSGNKVSAYTVGDWIVKTFWTRKWQPSPIFLLVKSHGRRSLIGYSPWGHRVSWTWLSDFTSSLHVFPNSHVWTWELDYKESWALKNWCFFFLF